MLKTRVKIAIYGKVQNVNFRNEVLNFAKKHEIFGWVKNTEDKAVLICAEGFKPEIEKLIEWSKIGPKRAKIETAEAYYQKYKGEFSEFEIK